MSIARRSLAVAAATAATLALAGASGASAATAPAPVVCDGALSNVTVGDVTVPYDASCTLTDVVVRGNVTARVDAQAVTLNRSAVSGSVTTRSRRLVVTTSAVAGDLLAREASEGVVIAQSAIQGDVTTTATQGELRLGSVSDPRSGNVVGGTLTVDSPFVDGVVARNAVAGDLLLTGAQATIEVRRNIVLRALNCTGNEPAPVGGSNLAGSKLDQCSAL